MDVQNYTRRDLIIYCKMVLGLFSTDRASACQFHCQVLCLTGPPPQWLTGNLREISKLSYAMFYLKHAPKYGKIWKVRLSAAPCTALTDGPDATLQQKSERSGNWQFLFYALASPQADACCVFLPGELHRWRQEAGAGR